MSRAMPVAAILLVIVLGGAYVISNRRAADDTASAGAADLAALAGIDARLAVLEADVASMSAYEGVWENELQYTRGLDRHDETLIRNSFWAEAEASYGTLIEIEELAPWANASHAEQCCAHHHDRTGLSLTSTAIRHTRKATFFTPPTCRETRLSTLPACRRWVGRRWARSRRWAPAGTSTATSDEAAIGDDRSRVRARREPAVGGGRSVCDGCIGRWDPSHISFLPLLQPLTVEERRQRSEQSTTPHASSETN